MRGLERKEFEAKLLKRILSPRTMDETRTSAQYIAVWNHPKVLSTNRKGKNPAWEGTVKCTDETVPGVRRSWTLPQAEGSIVVYRKYMRKLLAYLRERSQRLLAKGNTVGLRNLIVVELSALNGLRTSEVKTVRVEDIDFQDLILFVFDSKKHIYIPISLDEKLALDLEEYIRLNRLSSGFVLQKTRAGRKPNTPTATLNSKTIEQIWKTPCKRLGLPSMKPTIGRAYDACVMQHEEDAPTIDIQHELRHRNVLTTEVYLSMLDDFDGRHARFLARRHANYQRQTAEVKQ